MVETSIQLERYDDAERYARSGYKADRSSHWFLDRLGLALYEQHRYAEARKKYVVGLALAPDCPLLHFDLGLTLMMLGEYHDAAEHFSFVYSKPLSHWLEHECNEGRSWATSLHNDAYMAGALAHHKGGRTALARRLLRAHSARRRRGLFSIYSLRTVRALERRLSITSNSDTGCD